jgi:tRNA-dihydrouridine synthase
MKHYLQHGEYMDPLSFEEQKTIIKQQIMDAVSWLDERRGIIHSRRHLASTPVFKGIPNFKETRISMLRADNLEELFKILDSVHEQEVIL